MTVYRLAAHRTSDDQIVDPDRAASLQGDLALQSDLLAWIVTRDPQAYNGQVAARLVTSSPTPYVLLADNLGDLREMLPQGLECFQRAPNDPSQVIEVWFLASRHEPA